ncbi:uncharacterized protein LOC18435748 [Amborella trichopoda]|uniref:Uncharacterized protein n=1 Tax=Amborella trichopoda TaxID=13333 RepID=W1PC56_AMBTC|nr:uncharacterized protein LOC18435748 [Amborella trichopoda]ERN07512.1 hypothetical protein AMTR_s00154p00022230 [Amborella trichopoda]|eukprot:XP_006845837.1 uncharacterized protein LOC18435748 [Amborella trichopoda]
MASTSGNDPETQVGCRERKGFLLLGLQTKFCKKETGSVGKLFSDSNEERSLILPEFSPREVDFRSKSCKTREFHCRQRSWRAPVKPVNALESCLIAQLCREREEMGEFGFTPLPSPYLRVTRPALISDGCRSSENSNNPAASQFQSLEHKMQEEDGTIAKGNESVMGIPPLKKVMGIPPLSKPELRENHITRKRQKGKRRFGRFKASNDRPASKNLHSLGSSDGWLLFCCGIVVGVMSTMFSTKKEVDKLNELLKQSENLVQDLEEELEMKDSMTLKELTSDAFPYQENNDSSVNQRPSTSLADQKPDQSCSNEKELDFQKREEHAELDFQKREEHTNYMSKIEAELEAELERLELNINTSAHQRRFSGPNELDPDCMADIVHGELRADMVGGGGDTTDSNRDGTQSVTPPPQSLCHAVSPRELSVRLHQVIQSRLEQRIVELETALELSQKRLQSLENDRPEIDVSFGQKLFSSSEVSSTQESPTWNYQGQFDQLRDRYDPISINNPEKTRETDMWASKGADSGFEAYEEFVNMGITQVENGEGELKSTKDGEIEGTHLGRSTRDDEEEEIHFLEGTTGEEEEEIHILEGTTGDENEETYFLNIRGDGDSKETHFLKAMKDQREETNWLKCVKDEREEIHFSQFRQGLNGDGIPCPKRISIDVKGLVQEKIKTWEKVKTGSCSGRSDEGSSDSEEDEVSKLLIQHIVERAKRGSPALHNAQKILFSMDETLRK